MSRPTATAKTTSRWAQQEPRPLFPIAVVGISAGGLFALLALLRHLGPQPKLAVVIAHPLAPLQTQELLGILAEAASLPVQAMSDGLPIEPNQLYVLPPHAELGIADGSLRLRRIADGETEGRPWPIDRCFESLARGYTVRTLGVVLTGGGADGGCGIRAIKAEGGITFAQAAGAGASSARESAIATGCVDFVLPPEGIARELLRIGASAQVDWATDLASAAYHRILTAMQETCDIDFASYHQPLLRRRVQRRAILNGLPDLPEYADRLTENTAEARVLCDEVLSQATGFFGEPDVLAILKTTVFPRLLDNRPRDAPLRIWVAGASTGEEAYSVAISLLEFLAEAEVAAHPVKVFATDASASAIARARVGSYPTCIEREVSPQRLARFFLKIDGGYQLRKEVRDLCTFTKQVATRDPPFADMDLIVCRNLLQGLGAVQRERLLPLFHYALKESGLLLLGTAKTVRTLPGFAALRATVGLYVRMGASAPRRSDRPERRRADFLPPAGLARSRRPGLRLDLTPPAALLAADAQLPGAATATVESQLDSLRRAIQQLETRNEDLRAANEELIAHNEEFRSTNAALQLAKEELLASNEALRTINEELAARHREALRRNDDLASVLDSVDIPIVILGPDERIRRFTKAAGKLFQVTFGDIGRPLSDLRACIPAAELKAMIAMAHKCLRAVERMVQDKDGRWQQLTVRRYRAVDAPSAGTVLAAFDIDGLKRGAELLSESQEYAPILYELGIKEAVAWLAEELGERHGLRIELSDDDQEKPLDDAPATLLFRAVRELLMNVIKHAKTQSARVSLRRTGKHFNIEIEDQGVGFDASGCAFPSVQPRGGYGLFSVREQIGRLGGTVQVVSVLGQGTRVHIRAPLKPDALPPEVVLEKTS